MNRPLYRPLYRPLNRPFIKIFFWIVAGSILFSMLSCATRETYQLRISPEVEALLKEAPVYPDARFVVFSDPHFYDKRLGTSGKAFEKYLDEDRKLLVLSEEILDETVNKVAGEDADFVLVAGDLTKDGEKSSHEGFVTALNKLKASGTRVLVIPGNHDINNSHAVRFQGDEKSPVPGINGEEFKSLYHGFGYDGALGVDTHSLSYVAEPVEGLWVLALDSTRWQENKPDHEPITDGAFSIQTLEWIEDQLIRARKEKKAVIAMMHHGIIEHYPANEKFYGQYVIDQSDMVSKLLAAYGVRLVFTGHFHAQDITRKAFEGSDDFIFDIETGSLATAPCPYRVIRFSKGNTASVNSKTIDTLPGMPDFKAYAYDYVFNGTVTLAEAALDGYKVSKGQQDLITGQIAKAYSAHLHGDEKKPDITIDTEGFGWWLSIVAWMQKDLINGWWTDLSPEDNQLTIDLDTGEAL